MMAVCVVANGNKVFKLRIQEQEKIKEDFSL